MKHTSVLLALVLVGCFVGNRTYTEPASGSTATLIVANAMSPGTETALQIYEDGFDCRNRFYLTVLPGAEQTVKIAADREFAFSFFTKLWEHGSMAAGNYLSSTCASPLASFTPQQGKIYRAHWAQRDKDCSLLVVDDELMKTGHLLEATVHLTKREDRAGIPYDDTSAFCKPIATPEK